MKFSAQEEFGLRCLLQIARLGPEGSLTIPEIAKNEGMTTTHVAKLLMILRKDGFLVATRGQQGGYALARPADKTYVGDVLATLGGRLYDEGFCGRHNGGDEECRHHVDCSVRSLWQSIQTAVDNIVATLSLQDLLESKDVAPNVTLFAEPRQPSLIK
ncbi:Rrf2 family transcriptional regulator [bacterium]|nr:MAG: Rrf2 family transcriptional regulator [bacterium]